MIVIRGLWVNKEDAELRKWQLKQCATMLSIALAPPRYEGGYMGKACKVFGLHWWQKEEETHATRVCKLCGCTEVRYYTKEKGSHWIRMK